ncbi:MAG: shikimate dehydrogenase [Pseudomonadota bacterium]
MTDRYAVIGNPIAHSKSPQIHTMFAQQTGQDISYEAILAPLDGFAATVERLRKENYRGCNVTVPFKFEAWKLSGEHTSRAIDADAANTLTFTDTGIHIDNTDGAGLVRDIERNLGICLEGKRILLIGAGGAAHGILHPLLEAAKSSLVIYNRTLENALGLKKTVEQHPNFQLYSVKAVEFGKLDNSQFDLVIDATSAGLTNNEIPLPPGIFARGALAYDLMYGRETPFMKFARLQGAQVADGLGMLVEQAAEAFYIWRGIRPETPPVIAALRPR